MPSCSTQQHWVQSSLYSHLTYLYKTCISYIKIIEYHILYKVTFISFSWGYTGTKPLWGRRWVRVKVHQIDLEGSVACALWHLKVMHSLIKYLRKFLRMSSSQQGHSLWGIKAESLFFSFFFFFTPHVPGYLLTNKFIIFCISVSISQNIKRQRTISKIYDSCRRKSYHFPDCNSIPICFLPLDNL